MNYLKKLRIFIGAFLLKLKLKKTNHTPVICNLNEAKRIGIVFNSDNENDRKTAKELDLFFTQSHVQVQLLGYSRFKNNKSNLLSDKSHDYIHPQDFNWFYSPKNPAINNFIQHHFDILINLYQDSEFEVEYIVKLSNAGFKVGCAHLDNTMHDLMIDVSKNKDDSSYLSTHLKHYLSILKS